MKKGRLSALGIMVGTLLMASFPAAAHAEVISELHILPDGTLSSKGVLVTQKAGSNLFCRIAWGNTFIRMTVLLHDDTAITRKYGGKATVEDVKDGDLLEVSGLLSDGTGNLIVNAKKVKDLSIVSESKDIANGVISSIDLNKNVLSVTVKGLGAIKLALSTETPIKKGIRTIQIGELAVGDKILTTSGIYDYPTTTLNVAGMEVYQDKKVFLPKTFEGVIAQLNSTVLPTTLTLLSGSKTYTVFLSATTTLTSKSKASIDLTRAASGDKVKVQGSIRESDLGEIVARSFQDLSF